MDLDAVSGEPAAATSGGVFLLGVYCGDREENKDGPPARTFRPFLAAQVMLKVSRSAKKLISSFINARICLFYLPQFNILQFFWQKTGGV